MNPPISLIAYIKPPPHSHIWWNECPTHLQLPSLRLKGLFSTSKLCSSNEYFRDGPSKCHQCLIRVVKSHQSAHRHTRPLARTVNGPLHPPVGSKKQTNKKKRSWLIYTHLRTHPESVRTTCWYSHGSLIQSTAGLQSGLLDTTPGASSLASLQIIPLECKMAGDVVLHKAYDTESWARPMKVKLKKGTHEALTSSNLRHGPENDDKP